MRTLKLLLVAVMLSGCTSMLLGNTSSRETTTNSTTTTAADSAISGEIRRKFSVDSTLSGYKLGIRSQSGRVTLSGTVGSYDSRDRAVEIARGTDGVRSVDNRIIVNTNL